MLPVDLRSDTVTQPSPGMREAMARADVGDDWYGEDPTVNRLQEEAAALLGKEAGLFVPSGTMANQIALRVLCRHGDEVLVGEEVHIQWHENGAAGALAGVQLSVIGRGGLFSAEEVALACKPDNQLYPPTRLVSIENTHNRSGGRVWPKEQLFAVCNAARRLGLALHLDGARLWNAAVACGASPAELAAPFDTVSVSLSKGLGAPVGSLLLGGRDLIRCARRYRQMYGGGMRQAGVLAAAGLYALRHNLARLVEDHDNAAFLASRLAVHRGVELQPVETNILMLDLQPPLPEARFVVEALKERGVRVSAFGARRIRAVTHLDVDRAACAHAAAAFDAVLGGA